MVEIEQMLPKYYFLLFIDYWSFLLILYCFELKLHIQLCSKFLLRAYYVADMVLVAEILYFGLWREKINDR